MTLPEEGTTDKKTYTGWKLDVQAAVRADKKVTLAAASVFAAFMSFVNQDTRNAWPSIAALAIATGSSPKTIKKHMDSLVAAKWLLPLGKSKIGTKIYRVTDHRMNTVLDQITIDTDRHRKKTNERQTKRRLLSNANRRNRENYGQIDQFTETDVTEHGCRPNYLMSQHMGTVLSQNTGTYEHLQSTPSEVSYEGREEYRRATNGE